MLGVGVGGCVGGEGWPGRGGELYSDGGGIVEGFPIEQRLYGDVGRPAFFWLGVRPVDAVRF